MKLIPLTQGFFAQVSDSDYDNLMEHTWHVAKRKHCNYASGVIHGPNGKKNTLMHRFILGITDSKIEVDHADRNGLNNTRRNIRPCSRAENMANTGLQSNNKSGYKGVNWDGNKSKWKARIKVNGKTVTIGRFHTAEEAARAYDKKALELRGEFAKLNFTNENKLTWQNDDSKPSDRSATDTKKRLRQ